MKLKYRVLLILALGLLVIATSSYVMAQTNTNSNKTAAPAAQSKDNDIRLPAKLVENTKELGTRELKPRNSQHSMIDTYYAGNGKDFIITQEKLEKYSSQEFIDLLMTKAFPNTTPEKLTVQGYPAVYVDRSNGLDLLYVITDTYSFVISSQQTLTKQEMLDLANSIDFSNL